MDRSVYGDTITVRYLPLGSVGEAINALKGRNVHPPIAEGLFPELFPITLMIEGIESGIAGSIVGEMHGAGGNGARVFSASGGTDSQEEVILTGTLGQIRRFSEKIAAGPSELKIISARIGELLNNIMTDSFLLRTARREVRIGERTLIMGILNVTPDSFSDGGRFFTPESAVQEGIRMAEDGADIIDIGGESTRPGSESVSQEEELRRVIPVIKGLVKRIDLPVSIDTMKGAVAREALAEGAEIVNDISSLSFDEGMAGVVADTGSAVILMHMRGTPKTMQTGDLTYRSLTREVASFLEDRIRTAREKGIEPVHIMVDPGLGFGKTAMDNFRLISHLKELKILGRPIVTGVSRKSFIGHITGGKPQERTEGTAAAVTAAILNGSQVIRVHDVAAMKKVAAVADALIRV